MSDRHKNFSKAIAQARAISTAAEQARIEAINAEAAIEQRMADAMTEPSAWECEASNPNYDDETLHVIHDDINRWPEDDLYAIDAGDMQGYALEFIAQIRALTAERDALRAALQEIVDTYGHVCAEYEVCTHAACRSSHGAWETARQALRTNGDDE